MGLKTLRPQQACGLAAPADASACAIFFGMQNLLLAVVGTHSAWPRSYGQEVTFTRDISLDGDLPGEEMVVRGIAALERGEKTIEALLVSIGAARLRLIGLAIPTTFPEPEDALWDLLAADDPANVHSAYNALIRRLVSFERAAECLGA